MPAPKTPVASPVTFSFDHGEIQLTSVIDPETRQHLVTCDLCNQVIKLGIRGSIGPISQHKRWVFEVSKLNSKNRNLVSEAIQIMPFSNSDQLMSGWDHQMTWEGSVLYFHPSLQCAFHNYNMLIQSVIADTWPCPGVNISWAPLFRPLTHTSFIKLILSAGNLCPSLRILTQWSTPPSIPGQLLVQIFMIKEEEKALGILEHDTVDWRPKKFLIVMGLNWGRQRKDLTQFQQLILIVIIKKGAD